MYIDHKHSSINHILSNKVTVTALCKEGVRETYLFPSLTKPIIGKGKINNRCLSYMLCLEKHKIGIQNLQVFFSFSSGFASLGKNVLMSLNIVLEV